MIYPMAFVIAALVVFNLYASWKVLRDGFSTRTQKLMQLGVVWFLPIVGPVIATILVGETGPPTVDLADGKTMQSESFWHGSLGGEDTASDHSSSDHSCE